MQEIEQLLLGNQLQQDLKALMRCPTTPQSTTTPSNLPAISTNLSSSSCTFVCGRTYLPILEMGSFPHFLECSQSGILKIAESLPVNNQAQLQDNCEEDDSEKDKKEKEYNLKILAEELCDELSLFLASTKQWHNFTRYTPDVQLNVTIFKSNKKLGSAVAHAPPTIKTFNGLKTYKAVLQMYRLLGRTYLNSSCLEVVSMNPDPTQNLIEIRWRIVGFSPSDLISTAILRMSTGPTYYDFVSYFHVNDDGLVWRHDVENVLRFTDPTKHRSWKNKLTDIITIKTGVGV